MTSVPSKQENSLRSNGSQGKINNKNVILDTKFPKQDQIIGSFETYEEFKYVKNNEWGMKLFIYAVCLFIFQNCYKFLENY